MPNYWCAWELFESLHDLEPRRLIETLVVALSSGRNGRGKYFFTLQLTLLIQYARHDVPDIVRRKARNRRLVGAPHAPLDRRAAPRLRGSFRVLDLNVHKVRIHPGLSF
jgi:hypothetical protein